MNRLSIIMPVYNEQAYLAECIDSILRQTYTDFELIVVDDGSTDLSPQICDSYADKDSRIKVIHQENQGVIKARISGAAKSSGIYITFIDADDWIDEKMYEDLIRIMDEQQVSMVMSGMYRYHNEYRILPDGQILREGRYNRSDIETEVIPYMLWGVRKNTWEVDPSLWSKLFKREPILKHLLNTAELGVHYGDDTSVIFPLVLELDSLYVSHKIYYFHRQRENGKVASYIQDDHYFDKLYTVYQYLREHFKNSEYESVLKKQLDYFYMKSVQYKKKCYLDTTEETGEIFPFWEVKKESKVIIYGAGQVGCCYMNQNEQYHFCSIVAWVDKNHIRLCEHGKKVCGIEDIRKIEYDYIIIAVKSAELAKEIKSELLDEGIAEKKIIWNGTVFQRI